MFACLAIFLHVRKNPIEVVQKETFLHSFRSGVRNQVLKILQVKEIGSSDSFFEVQVKRGIIVGGPGLACNEKFILQKLNLYSFSVGRRACLQGRFFSFFKGRNFEKLGRGGFQEKISRGKFA